MGRRGRLLEAKRARVTEPTLQEQVAKWSLDPSGYALFAFPWGQPGPLENERLRQWQIKALKQIRDHLQDPAKRHQPCRIARASGHGIGKSAEIGIISCWALDTCEDARVVITANTEQQLVTKTSPEVSKWRRMSITSEWWKPSAMSIKSREPGHEDSWRLDFVTWSKTNTEAFAGLHNKGKRIVLIMDEGSGIDDKVYEVAQGALTDEDTEIIWIVLGNPTKNTGRFRECFAKERHLWLTDQIDSRDVEGTNKTYLQSLIDTYGLDSDIVRVRVLGQFPSASSLQFIGTDLVEEAVKREIEEGAILSSDPVIFGVDHARFGDDHSTLAIRQGRDAKRRPWRRWHGADSMTIAGDINNEIHRWMPDAIFIDAGGPNAGGVIDRLRQLNRDTQWEQMIFEINFGTTQPGMTALFNNEERVRVANKRAQMWQRMKTWLAKGAIPDEQQVKDDLTGVEYSYNADQAIMLEKKEHMKARGLASPDDADALALTFAEDVPPRTTPNHLNPENYGVNAEYDRYAELPGYKAHQQGGDYDRYSE
jgi:hypothetical protein